MHRIQGKNQEPEGKYNGLFGGELVTSGKDKSKVRYFHQEENNKLDRRIIHKLIRKEASAIFNARNPILGVKPTINIFKGNKNPDSAKLTKNPGGPHPGAQPLNLS